MLYVVNYDLRLKAIIFESYKYNLLHALNSRCSPQILGTAHKINTYQHLLRIGLFKRILFTECLGEYLLRLRPTQQKFRVTHSVWFICT
jgi:hypothetical protein